MSMRREQVRLNLTRNTLVEKLFLMVMGREFQYFGPIMQKALLSPAREDDLRT